MSRLRQHKSMTECIARIRAVADEWHALEAIRTAAEHAIAIRDLEPIEIALGNYRRAQAVRRGT